MLMLIGEIMNPKEYWNRVTNEKKFSTLFQMELFEEYVEKSKSIEI